MSAIIGAAAARSRRRIAEHFLIHDAVSSDATVDYIPESGFERNQFSWMLRKGLLREARPGAYWLDAPAWAIFQETQRQTIALLLGVIFVAIAAVTLLGYRS